MAYLRYSATRGEYTLETFDDYTYETRHSCKKRYRYVGAQNQMNPTHILVMTAKDRQKQEERRAHHYGWACMTKKSYDSAMRMHVLAPETWKKPAPDHIVLVKPPRQLRWTQRDLRKFWLDHDHSIYEMELLIQRFRLQVMAHQARCAVTSLYYQGKITSDVAWPKEGQRTDDNYRSVVIYDDSYMHWLFDNDDLIWQCRADSYWDRVNDRDGLIFYTSASPGYLAHDRCTLASVQAELRHYETALRVWDDQSLLKCFPKE